MKYKIIISYAFWVLLFGSANSVGKDIPSWWNQTAREAEKDSYHLITPEQLKGLYDSGEDFLLVDVRADYEYHEGHLPGAVNFEFDLGDRLQLKPEKRTAFKNLLGPDNVRKIIIYCRSFR